MRRHYVSFVPHLTDGAWELTEGRSFLSTFSTGTSIVTLVLEAKTPKHLREDLSTSEDEGPSDSLRHLTSQDCYSDVD